VENTALMPWIATTVFLHTSRIEERTGRWRRWNVMFASLPFALTVMGVYLTRSGVTGSIHSFAEDPVVGRILLGSAVLIGLIVAVVASRSQPGEPWGTLRLDRSGWQAVNALLLTAALVFVTAGSGYPAFASVFFDEAVAIDTRFFVMTVLPIAVAIAIGLTLALRRGAIAHVLVTVFLALSSVVVVGFEVGVLLIAPALASIIFIGFGIWSRRPRAGLLTAHLAHLGMALFLVGVAGSAFGGDFTGSMMPGETVEVAGHEITLVGVDTGEGDRYQFVRAHFSVDGAALAPEIRAYEDQTLPVAEPALRSTPGGDVIVAMSLLFPDGDTVGVSVFVRPLVWLVWVGAIVIGLAGLFALVSKDGAAAGLRRSATAGPRREGTTSETASR
ncbi:MAG: cytochrome c-type biogenesis CcmF C-terminal domain-containing protein, partial [Acidimicrobiia bacterium]